MMQLNREKAEGDHRMKVLVVPKLPGGTQVNEELYIKHYIHSFKLPLDKLRGRAE